MFCDTSHILRTGANHSLPGFFRNFEMCWMTKLSALKADLEGTILIESIPQLQKATWLVSHFAGPQTVWVGKFWSSKEDFKTYVVIFNKIFILHFWDKGSKDGKEWITCCILVSYRIMMLTIARLCLQVIDYWYISQQRATLCLVLKHFLWHYSIPRWIMCDTVTRWCGQIGGANRSVAAFHQIDLDKFNSKKWLCYTG